MPAEPELPIAASTPVDPAALLLALIGGSAAAPDAVRAAAHRSTDVGLLAAAALLGTGAASDAPAGDATALLDRAAANATTTRDRQLVAIVAAHLTGDGDRFDALVRDHLADHPDHILVAWIAAEHERS